MGGEEIQHQMELSNQSHSIVILYLGNEPLVPVRQGLRASLNSVEKRKVLVRFEVFTTMTMKNGVFWEVTPCGSCKNRRFRGT
jgi:hypothetical protein